MVARAVGIVVVASLVLTPSPINGSNGGGRVEPFALQRRQPADHTRVDSNKGTTPAIATLPAETLRVIGNGSLFTRERLDVAGKFLGLVISIGVIVGLAVKFLKWREDRFAEKVEIAVRKAFEPDTKKFNAMCDLVDDASKKIGTMNRRWNRHLFSMEEDIATTLAIARENAESINEIFFLLDRGVPPIERRDPAHERRDRVDNLFADVDRRIIERRRRSLLTGEPRVQDEMADLSEEEDDG